jgi:hypothetical protein
MNTREKPDAKNASNVKRCVISEGEIFADGAMIEPVSGSSELNKPNLLLWNGSQATVAPRVERCGCIYEAPELSQSLFRAIRLPARCQNYGTARRMFESIRNLFKNYLNLPHWESSLLACFSISTWLADRLLSALTLAISGPDQELGIDLLRLLSCVCRHPLMLAEMTTGGFRSLPMQFSLTLLLNQQELKPELQRLLRASNHRGLHVPGRRGSIVDLYGPKAIFCGSDAALDSLGDGVIHISAAPSQLQSSMLDEQAQNKIADDCQPRLLMYRLKNAGRVIESRVDLSSFTLAMRPAARVLAACFPEDSELARETVELLRPQNEEVRSQSYCNFECAIVEVLWRIIHDGKEREVKVDQLAGDVNALLRSRGEVLEYSAEEVGWKLRSLNIRRHTTSSGRIVLLNRDASKSVHGFAQAYGLPCLASVEAGCSDCKSQKHVHSK